MSGQKESLLVIGKSHKPRCFKGVKKLPVQYQANTNAWMTTTIFSDWVKQWDKKLTRNIILLIDNCTAHPTNLQLKHIKLVFLPANTTSILQPLDQGIIRTLKAYYRYEMRKRVLQAIDDFINNAEDTAEPIQANDIAKKTTLLDAVHLLKQAWGAVTESTVIHCFRKGGFTEEQAITNHIECFPIFNDVPKDELETWLAIDDDVPTSGAVTEEEICANILNPNESEEAEDEDSDEIAIPPKPPTRQEMMRALDVLRRGVQQYGDTFEEHFQYERYITCLLPGSEHQTKIQDFFSTA